MTTKTKKMGERRLMKEAEVAEKLGVSRRLLARLRAEGSLPYWREPNQRGGPIVLDLDETVAVLDSKRVRRNDAD